MLNVPKVIVDTTDYFEVDRLPDECSICHKGIRPIRREGGIYYEHPPDRFIEALFQCPSCNHIFIGLYESNRRGDLELSFVYPRQPKEETFPKLDELSS